MGLLSEIDIACPYCGEPITILVDESAGQQQYVEDCQVCCRPMDIRIEPGPGGDSRVEARSENE